MIDTKPTIEKYLVDGQPNWPAVDFDLSCSRCGYNLYMLTTPRCPECGLEFEWPDVLDAAKHRSRFLFEHNWRERPVYSFVRTFFSTLRPFRFWRQVSIHERPIFGPLLFLFILAVPTFFLTLHGVAYLLYQGFKLADTLWPGEVPLNSRSFLYYNSSIFGMLSHLYGEISNPTFGGDRDSVMAAWFCAAGLPIGAAIMLMSLRQTLGRCRVRTIQVFRVCAYAVMPAALVTAMIILATSGIALLWSHFGSSSIHASIYISSVLYSVGFIFPSLPLGLYLWVGLSRYLHLPRAFLLGIVSVGVSFLATFTLLVVAWYLL